MTEIFDIKALVCLLNGKCLIIVILKKMVILELLTVYTIICRIQHGEQAIFAQAAPSNTLLFVKLTGKKSSRMIEQQPAEA